MEPVPASSPTRADRFARALFFVVLFVTIFTYPNKPIAELDASWRMVLTQGLVEGWQFGRDLVFTYGPLGFLMGNTFSGVTFWPFLIWQTISSLFFAWVIYRQGMRLSGYARAIYWIVTLLVGVSYTDSLLMVIIALLGCEMIRENDRPKPLWSVATLVLFAVLAAIKFTNLMLAGFVVLVASGLDVALKRPGEAVRKLLWFFGTFLFIWVLCRQNLLNLPAYFRNSLEISSGYEQTMGLPTPPAALWKGLVVLGVLIVYALLHIFSSADRRRGVAGALVLGAFVYLNWKHGFVRADGHMIGFFICALVPITAFPALLDDGPRFRRLQRWLLVPAGFLCVLGLEDALPGMARASLQLFQDRVWANSYNTAHFSQWKLSYRDALRGMRAENEFPKTKAVVGDASIDVFGHNQSIALFNRFNYRPRPVIQGYSAYTPALTQLNADYYASDRAPEYVLFRLETIDDRFPMLDDARALYVFLHRYEFVHSEKNYQLWRRVPKAFDWAQVAPKPVRTLDAAPGQPIDLSSFKEQSLWVTIDLPRSLLGRARDFFYKPPVVRLGFKDTKGNTTSYRMPLPLARSGFIVNPMIEDIVGFMRFAGGTPERYAAQISVEIDEGDRKFFADTARVEISTIHGSGNGGDYFLEAEKTRFHMFKTVPLTYEAQTPVSEAIIDNTPVMVMHARSEMTFNIKAGSARVSGGFGMLPGTYTKGGNSDGAEFIVYWSNGGERVELFKRFLDPNRQAKDRGLHRFDVALPQQPGGRLFLVVKPGPNNNHSWDWTAWTGIEIK